MATPRMQPESGPDVANLANLFLGKNTTQTTGGTSQNSGAIVDSGTVTTSESVSPEAVNAVVKSILEGNQGLATVAGGQRRAGLYNSSTNQMLVNDLIARSAAEGAKLNRSQTVTTNRTQADNRATVTANNQQTVQKAPVNPGKAAVVLGGLQLIPKDVKAGVLDKIGLGSGKSKPASSVGGNATSTAPTNAVDSAIESAQAEAGGLSPTAMGPSQTIAPLDIQSNPGIGTSLDSQSVAGMVGFGESGESVSGYYGDDSGGGFDLGGTISGFADGSDGIDIGGFTSGIDTSNLGYDPEFDFSGFEQEFGGMDLGFAEGGLVKKPQSLFERRKAALDDAEDATVKGESTNDAYQRKLKDGEPSDGKKTKTFIQRLIPQFAEGGIVKLRSYVTDERGKKNSYSDPRSSKHVPEFQDPSEGEAGPEGYSSSKGKPRVPRYATGGMVDLTNMGLRKPGPEYASPMGVGSNNQSASRPNSNGTRAANSAGLNGNGSGSTPTVRANVKLYEPAIQSSSSSRGESDAVDNGMGTPGAGGMGVGTGTASAAGLGLSALGLGGAPVVGLANATNNEQAVNTVVSGIATALGGPIAGLVIGGLMGAFNTASAADPGVDLGNAGYSNEGSPGGAGFAGGGTGDGFGGVGDAVGAGGDLGLGTDMGGYGSGGAGGGLSGGDIGIGFGGMAGDGYGSGTSGGDVGGMGDGYGSGAGDSGGDTGWKDGGNVNGPGTSTSDSIVARLSDGEFVHKASAVKTFGEPFMEAVNDEDPVKALELLLTSGLIKSGPRKSSKGK